MVAELLLIPAWILAIVALLFVAVTLFLVASARKLLENTVLGLIALLVINLLGKSVGFTIGINFVSIAVTAILGLAGVGLLILLHIAGIKP
ncbi:pro-sigmaK processing inhibitor BofA family protein [Candidatus Micrarchaeota archaeon]|nr:pro-sigmaK processing inhibitor BofA family protein [Candidatus Micrarchaeota archaeon]MBI5177042.1 pro-sigmaK processing inhibitor BofA family protein [Candidatus Micrarchaeota archaeon]